MAKSLPSVVFLQLSAEFDSKSYAEFNALSPRGFECVFTVENYLSLCLTEICAVDDSDFAFICSLPVRYFLSMEIPSDRSVTISQIVASHSELS